MKVKVVARFEDFLEKVQREVGDTFECTAERFEEINSAGYGKLVEKVAAKRKPAAKED